MRLSGGWVFRVFHHSAGLPMMSEFAGHRYFVSTSTQSCLRCGEAVSTECTHCGTCGQHMVRDDPPEAWIGRVVDGKYEITEVLGVGGMGMVFCARRVLVGDEVALKVLFPRFLQSPLQRQLFEDEAVASARLDHPNVVTVFDAEFDEEAGYAYIAMELLRGRTYRAMLKEQAPMPPAVVLPIMVQVCEGLLAAHQARVIHRDLKPDNIFLEEREGEPLRVKLVDFGIAAMLDVDERDEQRRLLGTLRYMAPEQCILENPVDERADLYALGVVIYESLTRRRATGKTISAVLDEEVQPPNVVLPEDQKIPEALEDLVMQLLAKDPEVRPASAAAVEGTLLRFLEDDFGRQPEPTGERRNIYILVALVLAGLLGGVVWGLFQ